MSVGFRRFSVRCPFCFYVESTWVSGQVEWVCESRSRCFQLTHSVRPTVQTYLIYNQTQNVRSGQSVKGYSLTRTKSRSEREQNKTRTSASFVLARQHGTVQLTCVIKPSPVEDLEVCSFLHRRPVLSSDSQQLRWFQLLVITRYFTM